MMKSYYQVLGLNENASADEVKAAYKNLAKKHHPDKGGDPEKFKEINNAFERITNPERRPEQPDIFEDMARQFFGGHPHFAFFNNRPPHVFKQTVDMRVNLEDLYRDKHIRVNNQDVFVPANTPIHKEINVPNTNIVLMIRNNPHPVFDVEARTYNLVYKQNISLCEALLGFKGKLKHPNGSMLFLRSDKVVQNGTVLRAKNKGLPTIHGRVSDLMVIFEVEIPSNFDKEKYGSVVRDIFNWDVPELTQSPSDILTDLQ